MKNLLIIFFSLTSYLAFGQFDIGHRTITYTDPARGNRSIECEVYYPGVSAGNNVAVETGSFPVIVLGHGFAMGTNVYTNYSDEFVPDGYIMVMPNTEGSLLPAPSHQDFGLDLQFLATEMQTENSNGSSPFYQHVADRTGIMGHSMGGGATILGASGFGGVDCIVGLAPAETDPSAIAAAANVTAPALILSGESDGVTPPNDHHIPIYDALASSCKHFVTIENGSHCYFADYNFNCAFGEIIPGSLSREDQMNVSYALMHPWFDYFLKDDCSSLDAFETALTAETNVASFSSSCANNAPVISDNNGTLESDNQNNYQWYLNGTEIPNADQQNFTYTQSGTYQVGTVNHGNCPVLSNEIVIQITGIAEPEIHIQSEANGIQLYTRDELNEVALDWIDLSGRLIGNNSIGSVTKNTVIEFEKPQFNGVKILRLRSNEVVKTWRLF